MKTLYIFCLFLICSLSFANNDGPKQMEAIMKTLNSGGGMNDKSFEDKSLPRVVVKPKNYGHFRTTLSYEVLQKNKFGEVTTMLNIEETKCDVYAEKGKELAYHLMRVNIDKETGLYEIVIKLDKESDAERLIKAIKKAFKN